MTKLSRMDVQCRDCNWNGFDDELQVDISKKRMRDLCPECGSTSLKFSDGNGFNDNEWVKKTGDDFVVPKGNYQACHATHPPLKLASKSCGTDEADVIYGGSCINPKKDDCDIYIGFDHMMKYTARSFPWTEGEEFLYVIPDMGVPKKPKNFIKLVEWACEDMSEWWYNAGRQATLIRLTLPVLVIERIYNDISRL